jgi:hypothetical protein
LQVSQSSHAENGGSANGNNNADKGSPWVLVLELDMLDVHATV